MTSLSALTNGVHARRHRARVPPPTHRPTTGSRCPHTSPIKQQAVSIRPIIASPRTLRKVKSDRTPPADDNSATSLACLMARKAQKKRSPKQASGKSNQWLYVDPARVRFQHSRGCGRSVEETLESIRKKEVAPSDLPPIQVIVGPEDSDGPWYYSLNNRRLWVFKRCREEGLLENNVIRVRVREPKSGSEEDRYTLENCAVEAKFFREKAQKQNAGGDFEADEDVQGTNHSSKCGDLPLFDSGAGKVDSVSGDESGKEEADASSDSYDSYDSYVGSTPNPFSALM